MIALDQGGVVARAQLLAAGVSEAAIGRALRSGALHSLYPGVYSALAPGLLSEEGHLVAALQAAGEGAILSHGTAAWRWRIIPALPSVISWRCHDREGAARRQLHVSGRLRPDDTTTNGRFPTTTVARTLLDLAARYDQRALLRALAEAEFHHDLRPVDIERTLRRGHPGSAKLRAALGAHVPGHGQANSQLERRFRALLVRHGIALPERNAPVGSWTVDCLWPKSGSWSSSTAPSTTVLTRPTSTATATCGCAPAATPSSATATARSPSGPTTSSPTSSTRSADRFRRPWPSRTARPTPAPPPTSPSPARSTASCCSTPAAWTRA